eukprot:6182575-Pleurochrysis_carterae.AAC.1
MPSRTSKSHLCRTSSMACMGVVGAGPEDGRGIEGKRGVGTASAHHRRERMQRERGCLGDGWHRTARTDLAGANVVCKPAGTVIVAHVVVEDVRDDGDVDAIPATGGHQTIACAYSRAQMAKVARGPRRVEGGTGWGVQNAKRLFATKRKGCSSVLASVIAKRGGAAFPLLHLCDRGVTHRR